MPFRRGRARAPDAPVNDPNIIYRNARDYSDLLASAGEGHVLWDPQRNIGCVGDCGFIEGGRFQKLFNVFHDRRPSRGSPTDSLSSDDITKETLWNSKDPLMSSHLRKVSFESELTIEGFPHIPVTFSLNTAVESESKKVAYLAFCGPHRTRYIYKYKDQLQEYLSAHGREIQEEFKGRYKIKLHELVIIHTAIVVSSWTGGISNCTVHDLGSSVKASTMEVASAGVKYRVIETRDAGFVHIHGNKQWNDDVHDYPTIVQSVTYAPRWRYILWPFKAFFAGHQKSPHGDSGVRKILSSLATLIALWQKPPLVPPQAANNDTVSDTGPKERVIVKTPPKRAFARRGRHRR